MEEKREETVPWPQVGDQVLHLESRPLNCQGKTSRHKSRAVPNIQFEFEPDRIVGQMDYSYLAEYCHNLEPEYGYLITAHAAMPRIGSRISR